MARRKTLDVNETLSQEQPEVQEELLNELNNTDETQENEVEPGLNENNEMNNLSSQNESSTEFEPGDKLKLKPNVKFDLLGRRIHAGIQNYQYRVLTVRHDGKLVIECLTHCFTVNPTDVVKL